MQVNDIKNLWIFCLWSLDFGCTVQTSKTDLHFFPIEFKQSYLQIQRIISVKEIESVQNATVLSQQHYHVHLTQPLIFNTRLNPRTAVSAAPCPSSPSPAALPRWSSTVTSQRTRFRTAGLRSWPWTWVRNHQSLDKSLFRIFNLFGLFGQNIW